MLREQRILAARPCLCQTQLQYFYLTYTVLDDEGQLMLENIQVPSAVLMTPGMVPVQSKPRVQVGVVMLRQTLRIWGCNAEPCM